MAAKRGSKKRRSNGAGRSSPKRRASSVVTHLFGHKLRPEMRDSFSEWLTQSPFVEDADEASSVVEVCDAVLGLIGEHRPKFNPIAWVPDDAHALWDLQEEMMADQAFDGAEPGEAAEAMSMAPFVLLLYLAETGQWAGTEDDLRHCLNDLEPTEHFDESQPLTRSMVSPAVVDPAVERAALDALPLIQRLARFVEWFGTGKSVTGTGVLRPAHAAALAEVLDIDLPPGKLRTMLDVTELGHLWTVVQEIGLVAVSSTKAYPGSSMVRWLSSDPELLREAVTASVAVEFAEDERKHFLSIQTDILTVQYLLAGMTDTPLVAFIGPPPEAPPETAIFSSLLQDNLESLAEDGLIVIDDVITVPKPLQAAVLAGLPDFDLDDDLSGGAFDLPPIELPPIENVTEQEIALTIELDGCVPAVSRQVVVASTATLEDLHWTIQSVFGWADDHMHEFVDGAPYSGAPVYLPARSIADRDLPHPANAEESTAIGSVLYEPGRALTYVYDFGDDWFHQITVDSVGGALQQVPRCTGGTGMAPYEDSGGPPGWAMLVEAVNDPDHPQHEDMRDWTGLDEGLTIDPAAFDAVQADAGLRRMRDALAGR